MDHELDIHHRKTGDVLLLDLAGSLTVGVNEQSFRQALLDLLSGEQNRVLLNLGGVEFIDSSGIGALVKTYTTVTNRGGKLKLLSPNKRIRETLKITGLLGVFEIFEDENSAVASF
jgi:anti-sigma B factor antagonist